MLYGTLLGTTLEITAYSNLFGVFNNFGFLGLIGIATFAGSFRAIIAIAVLVVGFAMMSGSKGAFFYVLLPVFVILFHRKLWQPRLRSVLSFAIVVLAGLMVAVVVDKYRAASQRILMQDGVASFSPVVAFKELHLYDVLGEVTITRLVDRVTLLSKHFVYLVEADRARNLQRWEGESYLPLAVWFVPRALWSDKPVVSRGYWYGREILGWQYRTRSEAAITLWGDAYMNFGWVGVIFVPLVWIGIVFLVYEFSLKRSPWGLVYLGAVYSKLFALEQNMAVPLVGMMQTGLLVLMIYGVSKLLLRTTRTGVKAYVRAASNG